MLTIKTWCLPNGLSEKELNNLHNAMVAAVISIPKTGVKDESMMLNLFPTDMMSYGLGNEIGIEITKVPASCDQHILNDLAQAVSLVVSKAFPRARVECEALPFNNAAGFFSAIGKQRQFEEECWAGFHK